jgi:hypothetical protein
LYSPPVGRLPNSNVAASPLEPIAPVERIAVGPDLQLTHGVVVKANRAHQSATAAMRSR